MKREKTISKQYFNDEILFKDPDTGDIHLKPGVKRLHYPTEDVENKLESHINYWDLAHTKIIRVKEKNRDWDE